MRKYSLVDQCIIQLNSALQTLADKNIAAQRPNPAENVVAPALSAAEKRNAANLMRVNHAGEVCAQALYQGQALTARSAQIRAQLTLAAQEEVDHLSWCQQRITELGSHTSYLNPFWYFGSFTFGVLAGLTNDKISLGFVAETEHQVEQHLTNHLQRLPINDYKSQRILMQMRADEVQHAINAEHSGAMNLPTPVKTIMHYVSKVMTLTAYWC